MQNQVSPLRYQEDDIAEYQISERFYVILCDNLKLGKSKESVAAVINKECIEASREYIYYACSGARLPVLCTTNYS